FASRLRFLSLEATGPRLESGETRNPRSFRPSNSIPVIVAFCALKNENSTEDADARTVRSIGSLRFFRKKLNETSSRGLKKHSQRRSQLVIFASTSSGLPTSCSSPRGAR